MYTIIVIIFIYLGQGVLASFINIFIGTEIPTNFKEFVVSTFLPYVIYKELI